MSARPSDRFIPWYIVAFFVVQAVIFSWFVHLAHDSYPGVVTEKAYDKGLRYNDTIEKSLLQQKLGWSSTLDGAYKDGWALVEFNLKDAHDKPLTDVAVTLWLVRPVKYGMDFSVEMKPSADGRFVAKTQLPARGLWELRVRAVKGTQDYQASRKVSF